MTDIALRIARTFFCAVLLALAALPAAAQTSKLDPLARRALQAASGGATLESVNANGIALNSSRALDVFILGSASPAALEAAGATVRTVLPGMVTAYVPADAVERVAALPEVTLVRGATRVRPLLDASVPATGATPQRGPGPDFAGRNGAGVVIGIVDSGVDLDHGDFQSASGATRLLRVWDQTDAVGPRPVGFTYGTEWSASEIDAHVARETDDDGHGTHVLGIAGGDGSATGGVIPAFTYAGMAPKADLMVVKANFTDTAILDGVAWVMNRAAALGKSAVVNLSLGTLFGPKDGTSPFEAGLDALTGPGRIVVVAAGNDGGSAGHSEITIGAGATTSTTFSVSGSAPGATVALDGYYEASGAVTMTVTSPTGVAYGPIAVGGWNASYPGNLTACGYLYFENGAVLTATGDREVYVEINVPSPNVYGVNMNGTWTMTFTNAGGVVSHDESSEDLTGPGWNTPAGAPATPGLAPGASGAHLLLSEIGWRGLNDATRADSTEFLEITNPTAATIDLSATYLADVNAYAALPVTGSIGLSGAADDFAMRFPPGASIGPGQTRVIAMDGGRWKRATGADADFMMANAGGATSAIPMIDVSSARGSGYPALDRLANSGEFVWLFSWDGYSDLVCDVDFVHWGAPAGGNIPVRKGPGQCQDGPDASAVVSCYRTDLGVPSGSLGRPLAVPANGAGTRQRTGAEGSEAGSGNGCARGTSPAVEVDSWIFFANVPAGFALGNQPDHELIAEPGNAAQAITVGAWVTKNRWTDCGGHNVGYTDTPQIGGLAWFSSPGPTRDGREKPDLVAPGQGIASATSFDVAVSCPVGPSSFIGDGLRHWVYEGTSMAAPHVAGAVALILQKYGALNPDQVKAHLKANAVHDFFTGAGWNRNWGNGKLSVGDLTDPTVRVTQPNGGESLPLASPAALSWNASDVYGAVTSVDLEVARTNGGAYETIARDVPNTGSYAWTVTGPMTGQARLKVTAHDGGANSAFDTSDQLFTITGPLAVPGGIAKLDFALALASANPTAGAVDVEFVVPREAPVEVTVHDLGGRRIATLASGVHAAGRHRARWAPRPGEREAASGIYFVTLRAAGREITQRVAITR